jgi:hypothetical protein
MEQTTVTSMSYNECHNMQNPVVNTILPNMGINRNAAQVVMVGVA